jgi:hypothetical protein
MDYGTYKGITYDNRHGGPFDRGSADSYYGRGIDPHYYVGGTGMSARVAGEDMTPEELTAYMAGYERNEQFGDRKDYG